VELVTGYVANSPCLVTAGITETFAGGVSLWQHYAQPAVFGVPLSDLLHGFGLGAAVGLLYSATVALIDSKHNTLPTAAANMAQAVVVSGALGALAAISSWASVPTAAGWTLAKLAWKMGKRKSLLMRQYRFSSPEAFCNLLTNALYLATPAERNRLVQALRNDRSTPEFARFLRRHETNGQVEATTNWNPLAWIESQNAAVNQRCRKFHDRHSRKRLTNKP